VSLKDKLEALEEAKPRTFQQWLKTANTAEVELVMRYVHDKSINEYELTDTLRAEGIPVSHETIAAMRAART